MGAVARKESSSGASITQEPGTRGLIIGRGDVAAIGLLNTTRIGASGEIHDAFGVIAST
jgi:hypothetical protein